MGLYIGLVLYVRSDPQLTMGEVICRVLLTCRIDAKTKMGR